MKWLGIASAAAATVAVATLAVGESLARPGARGETGRHWAHAAPEGARGSDEIVPASTGTGQTRVLPWPSSTVWPTAVRLLRVDRGFTIVDRDVDAGYILFDFPIGADAKGRGSVEVFATVDASGREAASVQITTDGGPVHLPNALLDALVQKVREERGPPPPPPPRDPPRKPGKKPPVGGPDDGPADRPEPPPSAEDPLVIDPEDLPILE